MLTVRVSVYVSVYVSVSISVSVRVYVDVGSDTTGIYTLHIQGGGQGSVYAMLPYCLQGRP